MGTKEPHSGREHPGDTELFVSADEPMAPRARPRCIPANPKLIRSVSAILAAWLSIMGSIAKGEVDAMLTGRHIVGYQGWFGCPGDGRDDADWVHWFHRGPDGRLLPTVDLLP